MSSWLPRLKVTLIRYYSVPLAVPFRQFRNGLIYFAVGMGTVLFANLYMTPSLLQEVVVLFGLAMTSIGFLIAMLAQMRLIISRFVRFFSAETKGTATQIDKPVE